MATKRKNSTVEVYSATKKDGRTTTWVVRDAATGKLSRLTVSKSKAVAIDKIADKYSGAMKRLAKR
jgi:hypothetical protein